MADSVPTGDSGAGSGGGSSTADIAASVISSFESGGNGNDDGGSPSPTPGKGASAVKPSPDPVAGQADGAVPPQAVDEDDFDNVPESIEDALGRKQPNRIPHPRVKTMIGKATGKIIKQIATELGITKADAEVVLDDVIGSIKEHRGKITDYEGRINNVGAVEETMINDPHRFMQLLYTLSPEYGKYQRLAEHAAAAAAGEEDPMPVPDYPLGDGRFTYSVEGLKARDEWNRRQWQKEADAKLDERLSPIEQERKEREQQAAAYEEQRQFARGLLNRLNRARKWVQFKENEPEIMALLKKDNTLELEEAYHQVVMPKLAADRTKMRAEIIAEGNAQPRSTSVPQSGTPRENNDDKPKTTADIAREIIASMS